MRYKKLSKEQILISIDRLTRFKSTKEKYLRVFTDILISNLIEPKLKKSEIKDMDFSIICEYATEIFNGSFDISNENYAINRFLAEYENRVFYNDSDAKKLLNNTINFVSAIELIDEDAPVNLKWLKELIGQNELSLTAQRKARENLLLKFPIEEVVLVEGITEEILLPVFSKFLGHDFYAKGVQVIAAGGKNQVVKKYYELAEQLRLPIFVLLDKDAEENIEQIRPRLRKMDRIHLVSCGEFEDLLPRKLIVKTVNEHFKNFLTVNETDFPDNLPTAKVLEELFKTKGLHEFKKAEFAKLVKDNISHKEDISSEIVDIIEEIFIK